MNRPFVRSESNMQTVLPVSTARLCVKITVSTALFSVKKAVETAFFFATVGLLMVIDGGGLSLLLLAERGVRDAENNMIISRKYHMEM